MVVKMMKWSPWQGMARRKYKVRVKSMKLEGCFPCGDDNSNNEHEEDEEKAVMAVKVKWKGEPNFGLFPFHLPSSSSSTKQCKHFSREKIVKKLQGGIKAVEWDDHDDEFENICSFTIVSSSQDGHDEKFGPWDINFSILYGEKKKSKTEISKTKLVVAGRAPLNIAEMVAGKMTDQSSADNYNHHQQVEAKLAINLHIGGVVKEANFLVLLDFVEIKNSQDLGRVVPESVEPSEKLNEGEGENSDESRESSEVDTENAAGASPVTESEQSLCLDTRTESVKKYGLFSWKRRRLSFKPSPTKGEPLDKKTNGLQDENTIDTSSSPKVVENKGEWELKEVTSRDGQAKLKTSVFFASFDQCSDKAAGESACTALVAVIAHWLQLKRDSMPTRSEFDNLILEGSSEWRKLCENDAYISDFPNKHFDLETLLHADIRPIGISRDDSFVGFFSPEKFEALKEAMSFDDIWEDISRVAQDHDTSVYIVSWNDHFFVLKVEANAYYIIDTLGERLFEGCSQAYILKFDDSSLMYGKPVKEEVNNAEATGTKSSPNPSEDIGVLMHTGKECCKEFIKRFLAAIPLMELEAEEKKGPVSYYSLHHRLQIELNSSYLLSSSLKSSPFSSSNSASSFSIDECV